MATVSAMTSAIQRLRPDGLVHSTAFSHVAVVPPGATQIHVGGQNAVDASGTLIGDGDVVAQVDRVMANVDIALEAAGATFADLIGLSVVLVDGVDLRAAYGAAAAHLAGGDPPPLVSVSMVAALAVPGALVEVSASAAVWR